MATSDLRELIDRLEPGVGRALETAAATAGQHGHEEVRIEHLLGELLEGNADSLLPGRLQAAGVDVEALRDDTRRLLARVPATYGGRPAFGESLMHWLERGLLTATLHYASQRIIGAALVEALAGLAPRLVGPDAYRALESLDTSALRAAAAPRAEGGGGDARPEVLAQYTTDYTARAEAGELDPVLGRAQEIRNLVDALGRRSKNNPILVGEPGVGKTALVEGLALRIQAGEVPPPLQRVRLLGLDLGLLQAGASVKGEFEQRLRDVIEAVQSADEPIVLFVDEAHMLIGAGAEAGGSDAANLLKPALARGELRCIAATTWSEYKRYFERDAALARRFQLVTVDEPDEAAAVRMLGGLRDGLEHHHGVVITEDAVDAAVRLSARYVPARQLPDKAVDLMDTAASSVRLGQVAPPYELDEAREAVTHLERRRERLDDEGARGIADRETAVASLEPQLADAVDRRERIEAQWQREQALCAEIEAEAAGESRQALSAAHAEGGYVYPEVGEETVANVVAEWTGVPLGRMLEDDVAALLSLERHLSERVIGQDAAIGRIARGLRNAKAGMRRDNAPLGVFLLAGPSGVGKTETARALADRLFASEEALITINMSEYREAHSAAQLKGAPPGYVGYGEGGVLTEAVRRRPYAVILLDEVEKAHRDVLDLFYQIFDQGTARDGEGRSIDFRNTVLLMTSNLGAQALEQRALMMGASEAESSAEVSADTSDGGHSEAAPPGEQGAAEAQAPPDPETAIRPALLEHFGAALLARAEVVPYVPLDDDAIATVAALKLDALAERLEQAHGIELQCTQAVIDRVTAECATSESGARLVERVIEQRLMPGLAQQLLAYRANGDMPGIARLDIESDGNMFCTFADREPAAEAQASA